MRLLRSTELILKLEALSTRSGQRIRHSRAAQHKSRRCASSTCVSNTTDDHVVTCGSSCLSSGERTTSASTKCGFSFQLHHQDIQLLYGGIAIERIGGGLYRAALGASRITLDTEKACKKQVYFEVHIVDDVRSGGICIGVATENLPLNKMVGADFHSCGLHSSGQLVRRGGEFVPLGVPFHSGDRVGCVVCIERDNDDVLLEFWINGIKRGETKEALWKSVKRDERALYPAVSLYRPGSKVVLRCCAADWAICRKGKNEKDGSLYGKFRAMCGTQHLCDTQQLSSTVGNSSEE